MAGNTKISLFSARELFYTAILLFIYNMHMNNVNTQKRIGLLIDSLVGGGAERITLNLADQFSILGHDVHIFVIQREIHHAIEENNYSFHFLCNTPIHKSRYLNKRALAKRLKRLVSTIESDGKAFDFFISSAEDADRLSKIAGLANVYIRYRNSMLKYIEQKIGNKGPLKTAIRRFRWFRKFRSIYNNRNIITVSRALISEITEDVGVKPRTITHIYNPFNFERIRELGNIHTPELPDTPYIIYAAKLENRKRQDLLLRAYALCKPSQKLVLLGGTYTESDKRWEQKISQLIRELQLEDSVIMAGFHQNPYPWLKNADLFAMSSDSEGLPTVLIESLILGTPVVSTDCPTGPSEILTGEKARYLSPTDDARKLAENITLALKHYPEITETSLEHFSADYSVKRYLDHCCQN